MTMSGLPVAPGKEQPTREQLNWHRIGMIAALETRDRAGCQFAANSQNGALRALKLRGY
jgi:hypothetical protein